MDAPDEKTLVRQSCAGDPAAYGELVRRYQRSVFAVCYRFLRERLDAEDAAQEVFLRAHRYLAGFDEERPFGPWIRRIAANTCIDLLQRRGLTPMPLLEEVDRPVYGDPGGPEQIHIDREQQDRVRRAVASLPEHYRLVIERRHFWEESYQEIADALGLPLNTVKSHLLRGRKLLMERLRHG